MKEMKDKIEQFISDALMLKFNDEITEDSDLFQLGLIDSYGYIQILDFLEREFQITMTDEELLSNVLVSLSNMVNFVEQKMKEELV